MGFPEQDEFFRRWGLEGDAAKIYSMAKRFVVQGPGTYNASQILGYRVLAAGTADWTIKGVMDTNGVAVPPAAMNVGDVYAEHLSEITVPSGGSVLLYVP